MKNSRIWACAFLLSLFLTGCSKAELQGSIAQGLQKSCAANKEHCTVVDQGESR